MAEQMRPASPDQAPDPATAYERAKPEKEAGMGRLDNNMNATPEDRPDRMDQAVKQKQDPTHQINAEDVTSGLVPGNPQAATGQSATQPAAPELPPQPDHSMFDEEPMDWDQAPLDIRDPRHKRHPRTEGKGGTPDAFDLANRSRLHRER